MKTAPQIRSARLRELSQVFPVGLLGNSAPEVFRARREALLSRLEFPAVFAGNKLVNALILFYHDSDGGWSICGTERGSVYSFVSSLVMQTAL